MMRTLKFLHAAVLATALTGPALAGQGFVYLGQADYASWQLLGAATLSTAQANGYNYQSIALTQTGVGGSAGAAYAPGPVTLDFNQPFEFAFPFFIAAGSVLRGDGMAFVLASQPQLGDAGSGLGYAGLDGVAFAVDTFHFNGEPVSPSLQILAGGEVGAPLAFSETGLGDTIRDPALQWIGSLSYLPSGHGDETGTLTGAITRPDLGTFSVMAADVPMSAFGVAVLDPDTLAVIGRQVYYGFSAANGLADDGHFVTSAVPVPEPQTYAMLLAGMLLMGVMVQRRQRL
jgi:hypothetical protein